MERLLCGTSCGSLGSGLVVVGAFCSFLELLVGVVSVVTFFLRRVGFLTSVYGSDSVATSGL